MKLFRASIKDHLIILLSTLHHVRCKRAEKIRQAFVNREWPPSIEGECVTVSIGIAHYPQEATQLIELIAAADKAVYRAKRLGRNRVESNP